MGFKLGDFNLNQIVEFRATEDGAWLTGKVTRIDDGDPDQMYRIDGPSGIEWPEFGWVRALSADAVSFEFRYKYGEVGSRRYSDWMPVRSGSVNCYSSVSTVEFRPKAPRNDAEIVAQLRTLPSEDLSGEARAVLEGRF